MIPPSMPSLDADDHAWEKWVDANYPHDPDVIVSTRTDLDKLRGVKDRSLAAMLARLWRNSIDRADEIAAYHAAALAESQAKKRKGLESLVDACLSGKYGTQVQQYAEGLVGHCSLPSMKYITLLDISECKRFYDRPHPDGGYYVPLGTRLERRRVQAAARSTADDLGDFLAAPSPSATPPISDQPVEGNDDDDAYGFFRGWPE